MVILLFLFSSCGEQALFETEVVFEQAQWESSQQLDLDIEVEDVDKKFNLDLFVDHSTEYKYQNLYLNIVTVFPDGKKTESLIPVDLANKQGVYHGKCSGTKCKLRVFLIQGFKFKEPGKYKISVEQHSRENNLKGISNLKLALFENKIK